MDILILILRLLLALILLGANFMMIVLHKMPKLSDRGSALMKSFADTGYLFYFIKATEIVAGLLLLFNVWVPFALIILAPVSINIFLFHLFLTPPLFSKNNLPGLAVFVLNMLLLWFYQNYYMILFY